MAQDFGDDVGEVLFIRLLGRYCEKAAGIVLKAFLTDAVQRYHQQKLELEGKSKEEAAAEAEVLAKRPQVCVPFGDATRASYFAKVCQDNGVGAFAFSDDKGNGYVSFAKDDVAKVQDCVPQFSKVMTSLKYREINDHLEKAEPVPQEMFDKLKQVDLPDIDKNLYEHDVTLFPVQVEVDGRNEMWTFAEQDTKNLDIDAQVNVSNQSAEHMKEMVGKQLSGVTIRAVGEPYQVKAMELHEHVEKGQPDKGEPDADRNERQGHDLANDPYNHTTLIRDKVLAAREQCRDLEDFKAILAENGIGTRLNDDGELQFYEGRQGKDGEMLKFDKDMDWPVNAKTLAGEKYQCDATLDWFEKNTPKEPSGIDSLNHAHSPIPPQKDLNLICTSVRSDLEERGIQTLDRADGKMGFVVDQKYKQDVIKAVEARFPGLTPEELGIEFDDGHNDPPNSATPPVIDGSLDTDGRTTSLDQNIKSHDSMDTATNTARMEKDGSNTDVSPTAVREQSDRSREGYNFKSKADENRAASKQLSQTNDSPDRDISDKFQQER